MKLVMKSEGLKETVTTLSKMVKEGKSALNSALRDTGRMIVKELKKERKSGKYASLGPISKLQGHKTVWGKMQFVSITYKRSGTVVVTTKGLNKTIEEGGRVSISEPFKRYLHAKGIHLRGTTTMLRLPARPLFGNTWSRIKNTVISYFEERFIYRLNRILRQSRFTQ